MSLHPRCVFLLLFAMAAVAAHAQAPGGLPSTLGPQHVAIIFNRKAPASQAVALAYATARGIDPNQMIGLDCPITESITRKEFRDTIQEPLRREFSSRDWWELERSATGIVAIKPVKRVLALIHGMPLRISRDETASQGKKHPMLINEASVDSELMVLGAFDAPIDAPLNNPYFDKKTDFVGFKEPGMYLVSRIDGPDAEIATRLATEAVAVEEAGGPWGRTVLDLYGKGGAYQLGDDWIARIFNQAWDAGMPAQIDRHPWTLPEYYPLTDCAMYFGWYEGERNGFTLDPAFKFRRGAVAVHLHSFSAATLRHPDKHWAGPLLARGATATLGNVWEPYLQMTHHFDKFHAALVEGYTLAEASAMSLPVVSWMNICVGDPLYRPFAKRFVLSKDTLKRGPDTPWMIVHLATARWGKEPARVAAELRAAGRSGNDGVLLESAGWLDYTLGTVDDAKKDFEAAAAAYPAKIDQLRCQMHVAETLLALQQKPAALKVLRAAEKEFAGLPQAKAVTQHIARLDPPPPPPAPAKPAAAPAR